MNLLGSEAEKLAAKFLQQQGLTLITSNFNCRFGEIDLVMRDEKTLVFVEVRLRSAQAFGGAGGSITLSKQQKLIRTAEYYMQLHGSDACRFDAILMHKPAVENIEWIRNAFDA
ncbi:MAG TPA: YraN family protein [Methylophilaceae bacterium]|nr:YraN family protein [Methylophilaceae bacterium]